MARHGGSPGLGGRAADVLRKSVEDTDDVVEFPHVRTEIV
jgi:hypothetical protein